MNMLLLIDGNAVLHRAYYALPDWRNRSGEATAGVYGFLSMLMKAIDELKPTHLAIAFDNPEPTFRHEMYVGYQSNREKERQVSEDIWGQVEKLKEIFRRIEVPVYSVAGFEADDVIGTVANKCTEQGDGCEVVIITGDKDLMQLVNEKIKLFMPQKGFSDNVIVDEEKVMEKLGVHPNQVVDYKGLVGDSSDNYPGAAGIGPKTAVHLLAEVGNLDRVYENIGGIGELVRNKLVNGYEAAKLSQRLAMIRKDAPVTYNGDKCKIPDPEKFTQVFGELKYKSLVRRTGENEDKKKELQEKLF